MSRFSQFNQPQTLLVFTTYPNPGSDIRELNAIAWHSRKTLHALSRHHPIVVFAQKNHSPPISTDGPRILIMRTWQPSHPLSLLTTITSILKFNQAHTLLFQFEFNILGSFISLFTFTLMLLILKIFNKTIIFELHQVINHIATLGPHLHLRLRLTQKIIDLGLSTFYRLIALVSSHIIILEEELKNRLRPFIPSARISFIPIATTPQNPPNRTSDRHILKLKSSDFVLLLFGFVSWYKGSDWLVDAFSRLPHQNLRLILAGGMSPTLKDKPYYRQYFNNLQNKIKDYPHISLTGFVPDNQIAAHYAAADLIILPYRTFMSASGPLSFAFSFSRPFIISRPLAIGYLQSPDFHDALTQSNLNINDLSFTHDYNSFYQRLSWAQQPAHLHQLTRFSSLMGQLRHPDRIFASYSRLIDSLTYYASDCPRLSPDLLISLS